MRPWYDDVLTLYWYDQYTRTDGEESFRQYDPERIVAELLGLGADIYVLYAVSQMGDAYYPSDVFPPHPALEGKDYVADLLGPLKEAGKRVVLYVNWGTSYRPEWRERAPDGTFSQKWDTNYYVPCLNSPQRDVIRKGVEELAERYACDGLSLDMFFSYERCTCRYCQPYLKRLFGTRKRVSFETIAEAEHMPAYARWRESSTADYLASLNAILEAKGIVPFHNGAYPLSANIAASGMRWREELDPYVTEVNLYNVGIATRLHAAMERTSCSLITSTASDCAHTPISLPECLHYAAGTKGSGGRILGFCGVGAYPDTTSSKRLLDNVRKTFAFYKKNRSRYRDALPAGEVGMVYSYETTRHEMRAWPDGPHHPAFYGMSRLLHEAHLPWHALIPEVDDTLETLSRYRLLLLPAVACLPDRFVEHLIAYMENGGRVLATGPSGFFSESGARRGDAALERLWGIADARPAPQAYFHVWDSDEPIGLYGRRIEVRSGGTVLRRFVTPGAEAPVFVQKDILPGNRPAGPAVVHKRHGKGAGVYAAFEPGRFYYTDGQYQTRALLESLLAEAYPHKARQVRTNLPDTVELSLTEQPAKKRRIYHLVNKTTSGHYMGRETNHHFPSVVPVSDIEVTLRNVPRGADVSLPGLRGEVTGKRTKTIRIPRLEQYGAIVIET